MDKKNFKNIGTYIIVGLIFLFFTAIITYPLIIKFGTVVPGIGDVFIYMWTLWWFAYALIVRHQFPLFTDLMFYPLPLNIAQDVSIVHGMVALPVSLMSGPIAAYNFIIFFTFIVTGIGFYLFLKLLTKSSIAAFFGSFIYTFSYYRIFRALVGHLDLASTEWYGFSLYFLSLLFIYQKRKWKNYFGAAVFMALTAYTEYRSFLYFAVFSVVFFVVSVTARLLINNDKEVIREIYEEALSYSRVLVLLFVFVTPLLAINLTKTYDVQFAPTYPEFNAVMPAFFLPPCGTFFSSLLPSCFFSSAWEGKVVYLGVTPLVLMIAYLFAKKDRRELMLSFLFGVCFLIFIILSLGTKTPLYSWLFENISLFRVMRVPSRFIVIAEISLAVFAAFSLQRFFSAVTKPLPKYLAASLLLLLLLIEARPSDMKTVKIAAIPQEHLKVIKPGNNYSILEIPFGFRGNIYETFGSHTTDISFFYQMIHRTPLIGGYMSMIDEETWATFRENQLIQKLVLCQETGRCADLDDKDRNDFSHVLRIRYVVFLNKLHKPLEQLLVKEFNLRSLYVNGHISVWENPSVSYGQSHK